MFSPHVMAAHRSSAGSSEPEHPETKKARLNVDKTRTRRIVDRMDFLQEMEALGLSPAHPKVKEAVDA